MMTIAYGILLCISILIIIYMAQKNYENMDIRYWSIVLIIPIIILGYWLKTRVTTAEGAALCFCMIYLDSTVLLTIIIFCILHFLHIPVKRWVKAAAYVLAFAHIAMIWFCMDNKLYYSSMQLTRTGMGTVTKMTSGPLKLVHWVYLVGILLVIMGLLVTAFFRKGTFSRRSLYLYTFLVSVGLLMYVVETLIDIDFSLLPFLYVVSDLMIAKNYDHSHMHDIAGLVSDQQENHDQRGYAAFDLERRFLSCNQNMYKFLPELSTQIVDAPLPENSSISSLINGLIDSYESGGPHTKKHNSDDRIYQFEISGFSLRRNGKHHGYLFDVRDVTREEKILQVMTNYSRTLNEEVGEKTRSIQNIQRTIVLGLANMVENRDNNTGGHIKRTSDIIGFIVEAVRRQGVYEINDTLSTDIVRAAPMHDLGKITIENSILLKPGKLTDEEYAIMKTHSVKSGEFVKIILEDVEEEHFVSVAFNVARYHHERWDGRGYPEGLVGSMIPIEARIMAIADVYDALVSKRCYKKPMSFEKASQIMLEGMGTQFDPNMYTVFLDCRRQLEDYYRENERTDPEE